MKKFKAKCIQWDRTDDDGMFVDVDLPSEVEVTLGDLGLPEIATIDEVENELAVYLSDYYGFCHGGFFFEEVDSDHKATVLL